MLLNTIDLILPISKKNVKCTGWSIGDEFDYRESNTNNEIGGLIKFLTNRVDLPIEELNKLTKTDVVYILSKIRNLCKSSVVPFNWKCINENHKEKGTKCSYYGQLQDNQFNIIENLEYNSKEDKDYTFSVIIEEINIHYEFKLKLLTFIDDIKEDLTLNDKIDKLSKSIYEIGVSNTSTITNNVICKNKLTEEEWIKTIKNLYPSIIIKLVDFYNDNLDLWVKLKKDVVCPVCKEKQTVVLENFGFFP